MANSKELSPERYQEILEQVVFEGHYSPSHDIQLQNKIIQLYGGRITERGVHVKNAGGEPIQPEAEPWEADRFRLLVGDLQHVLGPAGLTDHLKTLSTHAPEIELKRFYARTRYREHPVYPSKYQLPIRTLDGLLRVFSLDSRPTAAFGQDRDLDCWDMLKECEWPENYPADFYVTSNVVTCLRPLDSNVLPSLVIGLGLIRDLGDSNTDFILVWFLDQGKLGLVYDYTKPIYDDDDDGVDEEDLDLSKRTERLKGSFMGVDVEFSMATLEGDFHFGDGQDPERELQVQLGDNITFDLRPFAYNGFEVEDACRYQGVVQPFCIDLLRRSVASNNI